MNTIEVIKKHLCEYEAAFVFNVAEDLGISPKDIQVNGFTGDLNIDGQHYRVSSVMV